MRGESVSRLETFVDAAFAFAVTMMVISVGSVPANTRELMLALHRVPTFASCFLILMLFWAGHNRWSRRFGLETAGTTVLSLSFVLVVLVWLYPLRMVMAGAFAFMTHGWVPSEMQPGTNAELQDCFLIYGVGFGALSGILLLLDRIAIAKADELRLDEIERLEARRDQGSHALLLGFAVVSVILTFCVRSQPEGLVVSIPGFIYMLIGPAMHFHHARFGRLRKALPPRAA